MWKRVILGDRGGANKESFHLGVPFWDMETYRLVNRDASDWHIASMFWVEQSIKNAFPICIGKCRRWTPITFSNFPL